MKRWRTVRCERCDTEREALNGAWVAAARARLRLTQRALAARAGISRSYLSGIEGDTRAGYAEDHAAILRALTTGGDRC